MIIASYEDKLAFSVNEFCEKVGLGRTTFYKLLNDKEIRTVVIGGRRLIPVSEVERLLSNCQEGV